MHLEPIDHQAAGTETSEPRVQQDGDPTEREQHTNPAGNRSSRRRFMWGTGALLVGAALGGCSTGTSRDAERGREKDASRESVVKELQATETWNLVNATPPPGTSTPEE